MGFQSDNGGGADEDFGWPDGGLGDVLGASGALRDVSEVSGAWGGSIAQGGGHERPDGTSPNFISQNSSPKSPSSPPRDLSRGRSPGRFHSRSISQPPSRSRSRSFVHGSRSRFCPSPFSSPHGSRSRPPSRLASPFPSPPHTTPRLPTLPPTTGANTPHSATVPPASLTEDDLFRMPVASASPLKAYNDSNSNGIWRMLALLVLWLNVVYHLPQTMCRLTQGFSHHPHCCRRA